MTNIYGQWADYYHDLGLNPIPIKDGKRPAINRWEQRCLSPMSYLDLEKLVSEWGTRDEITGIGVALTDEICAVDIDTFDKQFIFEASEILTQHGHLELSARRGQEGKGFAVLMRRGPGVVMRKRTQTECIEILSKGAQIVMPPSIHPVTKKPYVWLGQEYGFEGDPCHVDDLPTFTLEMQEKLLAAMNRTGAARPDSLRGAAKGAAPGQRSSIGGRNNKLTEMAWAKACEGVSLQQGAMELLEYDKQHSPPFFSDMSEPGNKPDPLANATFMYRRALKKLFITESPLQDIDHQVIGPIIDPPNEPTTDISITFADQFRQIRKNSLDAEPLMETGAFKLFYELSQSRSSIRTPMLTLGGALTLMSMWAANLFEIASSRGNIFVINLAPSGSGKSVPQTIINQVMQSLHKAPPGRKQHWPHPVASMFLGQGKYRSNYSVREGLERNQKHARFDIQDEVGDFFKRITYNQSAASIVDSLQNVWSAADSGLPAEIVADKQKAHAAIANPYVTWFGSTTYNAIQQFITSDKIDQGLIPRVLWMTDAVSSEERLQRAEQESSLPFAVRNDDIVDDDYQDPDPEDALYAGASKRMLNDMEVTEHPALVALRTATAYWLGKPPINTMNAQYDSEQTAREIPVERLKMTRSALVTLKALELQEIIDTAKLEETASPLVAVMRRRVEQIKRLSILAWMATEGLKEGLSGGEYRANRLVEPQHIEWASSVWDRMWAGFNVFLELDSTSSDSVAGVLDQVRAETLAWLRQEGTAQPSRLKETWTRKLRKIDRAKKVNDGLQVFNQTVEGWVKYGNAEWVYEESKVRTTRKVRFLSL